MSLSLYLHLYFYLNQGWLEKGCTQSPRTSFDVSGLRRVGEWGWQGGGIEGVGVCPGTSTPTPTTTTTTSSTSSSSICRGVGATIEAT